MSDLQDLIHKTSIDCIEKGKRMERERIAKLLEGIEFDRNSPDWRTLEIVVNSMADLVRKEPK